MTDLSVAGSQAEQRDMHDRLREVQNTQDDLKMDVQSRLNEMNYQLSAIIRQDYQERKFQAIHHELQNLASLVQQLYQNQGASEQTLLQELVAMKQDIKATQINIHNKLSDIQLTQALSLVSSMCTIDSKSAYERALLLRKVRRVSAAKCVPFWDSQQLRSWDQSASSSSLVLRASLRDRLNVRDFCTNVIEQLLNTQVTVLWILHQKNVDHNIFEILKSLISQALSKNSPSLTNTLLSSYIQAFRAALSLEEYVILLANTLACSTLTYIIIDTCAISSESVEECHWIFTTLPQLLSEQSAKAVLKVLFVTHGPTKLSFINNNEGKVQNRMVLRVGQTSKRKGKRIPQAPLKSKSK